MQRDELEKLLYDMQSRTEQLRSDLHELNIGSPEQHIVKETTDPNLFENEIYNALNQLNTILADMYTQVKLDMLDSNRISWAGTAHAIREILVGILRTLAPDDDVIQQKNFKLEKGQDKPTHAQRASYILKKRGASSNEEKVVREVEEIDEWISKLVRATYSRASDAAHRRYDDKHEVQRILNYFEAFARDLLDI